MALITQANPTRCCIVLQQQLEDIMGDKAPGNVVQETGVLNALKSPQNTTGFEVIKADAFPGKGKFITGESRPKLEIRYRKPICGDAATEIVGLCGEHAASEDPYAYVDFEFPAAQVLGKTFKVTQSDFDRVCEGRDSRIAESTRAAARIIRYSAEKAAIERMFALVGNYPGGANSATSPTTLKIMGVNAGQPYANAAAFLALRSAYRKMHTMDQPILVGDDALARYFDMRSLAGLGQNALFADPNAISGVNATTSLFLDAAINAAGGSGYHALSWLPGTAQFVTWNKYTGERETLNRPDYVKTTIEIDGLLYDLTMNYEKCDDDWDFELSLHWEIFALTDQMSPCYDFNYLLHWLLDCGDSTCDDLMPVADESESV